MTTQLTKHHGFGNDFLVALQANNPALVASPERSVRWCDRHYGIGADGVLYGFTGSDGADLEMVLHNADGSIAEISGNGIRCLGQAWMIAQGVTDGTIVIDTPGGRRNLVATPTEDVDEVMVAVDMGMVTDGPPLSAEPNLAGMKRWQTASVGNPHLVIELDHPHTVDLMVEGPRLEALAEGGLNVHLVHIDGPNQLTVVHWERGAGVTLGCGSGATATAWLTNQWGLTDRTVSVQMPGGTAQVQLGDAVCDPATATTTLIGPAVFVAEVSVR